jgi:hypothetical protein
MSMARDLVRALDPVLFARACGIEPDAWQCGLLRSRPRKALLNCSRQSGKTTTTAIIALEIAVNQPGSLVIIGAPAQRQSVEMLRKVRELHAQLDGAPELPSDSVTKLEFGNRSRIVALPGDGKTVRGLSAPAAVILDEASFAEPNLIQALTPMLATSKDGRFLALSTPAGAAGWFYDRWHDGDPSWLRIKVPASQCPRISPDFLREQLRELGPTRYAQEFECEFVASEDSAFANMIIDSIFTDEVTPLWA